MDIVQQKLQQLRTKLNGIAPLEQAEVSVSCGLESFIHPSFIPQFMIISMP
jgi:hypothetical protein